MAGKRSMGSLMCKFIIAAGIIVVLAVNMGCGEGLDVFEQVGSRYHTGGITLDDNGDDSLADVIATTCTTGSETIETGWLAVTVTSDEDMDSDAYIYAIAIDITPDSAALPDFTATGLSCLVDSNGGSCEVSLGLFPPAIKAALLAEAGTSPFAIGVTFTPLLTYTIQEPEHHYSAPAVSTVVTFGEVDNCSGS